MVDLTGRQCLACCDARCRGVHVDPTVGRHMYHSARWGGWQFALHSRNDTDHSLNFKCNMINPDGTAGPAGVACPRDGDPVMTAVVQGGWQEGRGSAIGPQYTLPSLNNSCGNFDIILGPFLALSRLQSNPNTVVSLLSTLIGS